MGVDPLDREWGDIKLSNKDKEYITRVKEVKKSPSFSRTDGSYEDCFTQRNTLSNSWD
jgi:hypothetical protein